eukprot:58644-Lingulodinium_polyedra.AAC.1
MPCPHRTPGFWSSIRRGPRLADLQFRPPCPPQVFAFPGPTSGLCSLIRIGPLVLPAKSERLLPLPLTDSAFHGFLG